MTPAAVFSKIKTNLAVIKPHLSKFSPVPNLSKVPLPTIVVDPETGDAVDFVHGYSTFYGPGGARDFCKRQVEQFRQTAPAFHPQVTMGLDEDRIFSTFAAMLDERTNHPHMHRPKLVKPPGEHYYFPDNQATTLVVFGLGLGYHMDHLLDAYETAHLIVCEVDLNVLAACLAVFNWTGFKAKCKRRGVKLSVVVEPNPVEACYDVLNVMRDASMASIVGARVFQHYAAFGMDMVRRHWPQVMPLANVVAGYWIDEFRQCLQARENLKTNIVLTKAAPPLPDDHVAVVVGSGPSLDKSWDLLHRLADKAYIFSCGTGLAPLLSHGIMPDVHVEMETHPSSDEVVALLDNADVYNHVPLLAPASGYPAAISRFRHRYLFARETSCSTMLFEGRAAEIQHAFARVGNAGAALAMHLGFRHVILLGMDTGYRPDGADHARDTIYGSDELAQIDEKQFAGLDKFDERIRRELTDPRRNATFPIQAIDGKPLFADPVFAFSKSAFTHLMEVWRGRKLYQVGDGAALEGAINSTVEAFTPPVGRKPFAIDQILDQAVPKTGLYEPYAAAMRQAAQTHATMTRNGLNALRLAEPVTSLIDYAQRTQAFYEATERFYAPDSAAGAAVGLARSTSMSFGRALAERASLLEQPYEQVDFLSKALPVLANLIRQTDAEIQENFR